MAKAAKATMVSMPLQLKCYTTSNAKPDILFIFIASFISRLSFKADNLFFSLTTDDFRAG